MNELFKKIEIVTDRFADEYYACDRHDLYRKDIEKIINICMDAAMDTIDNINGISLSDNVEFKLVITKHDAKDAIESLKEEE